MQGRVRPFTHTGIQHEFKKGEVYTRQFTYIEAIEPILTSLYEGIANDKEVTDRQIHEAYKSCLGPIAWVVLSRPNVVVYFQALQRRGSAPRVIDVKRCNLVIRYLRRFKGGIKAVKVSHPRKIIGFTDAAFKALLDDPTGLALRGLATMLREATSKDRPRCQPSKANLIDFTVRRQRGVVRFTFSAEPNGHASITPPDLLWHISITRGID